MTQITATDGEELENAFQYCDLCNKLCEQIPQKCLKNFRTNENIRLTCLDASEHLIVLGSNVGTVFVYNRMIHKMSQIKGQDESCVVKLSENLFYDQIAVGLCNGYVIVLQLPSPKVGFSKKLIEKSLREMHKCRITCLEWSLNGSKLFSGDSSGLVMMTLLDFENDLFHSSFVCCEESPIVQLSFCANYLGVSTSQRTLLVDIPQDCAIKPLSSCLNRKKFDSFGIIFEPFLEHKSSDVENKFSIYTAEPDFILYKNDDNGNVLETVDCKSTIRNAEILSLAKDLRNSDSETTDNELGFLKLLNNTLLLSVYGSDLFIIDLEVKIVKYKCRLFSKIRDFSISKLGEIFVLCGERAILRFASFTDDNLTSFFDEQRNSSNFNIVAESSSSLFANGKMLLKKITDPHINFSNDATGANVDQNKNKNSNLSVDVKSFFGKLRRQEEQPALISSSSGMSTPELQDDSASLNDDKENWISCMEESVQLNTIEIKENNKPKAPSQLTFQSYSGVLSTIIETVGGFGVQSETGEFLPVESDAIHVHNENVSKSENSSVSVFHKFSRKKQFKEQQAPCLHPVEKLATPTEDEFSKNRYNPFNSLPANQNNSGDFVDCIEKEKTSPIDEINTPLLTSVNRETLEQLLDSSLFSYSDANKYNSNEYLVEINNIEPANQNIDDTRAVSTLSLDVAPISGFSSPDTSSGSLVHVASETLNRETDHLNTFSVNRESTDYNAALRQQLDIQTDSNSCASDILTVDSDDTTNTTEDIRSLSSASPDFQDADIWNDTVHSHSLCSISGSSRYICCVDSRKNLKYSLLGLPSFVWQISEEKADQIGVSPKGTVVWRLYNNTAWVLLKAHKNAPKGMKWLEAAPNVSYMAVSDHTVWYLRLNGELLAQTELRADRPCYKARRVDCPKKVSQISCSNDCCWVLVEDGLLLIRTGITNSNRLGDDWVEFLPIGPSRIVSISLYGSAAWLLDENNNLWFCHGLSAKTPLGTSELWQVSLPESLTSNFATTKKHRPCSVFSLTSGLWIAYAKCLYHCRGSVTGHHWSKSIPSSLDSVGHFRRIAVANVFDETTDYVWLQRANMNHEIMAFQPKSKMLHSIPPVSENEPVALSATVGVVWLLDSVGNIFIRHQIGSVDFPFGTDWQRLDMSQLADTNDGLIVHLCCSMDTVWACTTGGKVYVRIGTSAVNTSCLTPAWVLLDCQPHCPVRRIFCSSDGNFVWALSDNYKILVRLGVTSDIPIGTGWMTIDDMKARHLAVGFKTAWALSFDYQVFQRYGIDDNNPAGNYWKPLPGQMRFLSTTPNNNLWAIDMNNRLVKHKMKIHYFSDKQEERKEKGSSDDFEVV